MEDILGIVSADVRKNFYDPNMKGLDWTALTEETRQRIDSSNNVGQMIMAICLGAETVPATWLCCR